ncbi:MAG: regulatory iron-sulfur-containing complex subunit RicT [Bacteroidales bacterium]
MKKNKEYDCLRGCEKEINNDGETTYTYNRRCCKLSVFNWLSGVTQDDIKDFFEVRFKNTRKIIYKNDSGQNLKIGDVVVVEAQNGCDVGLITLAGPIIVNQLQRDRIDPKTYEFKKIYRKARPNDIEKWQEAVAREHKTMIRSRQMASDLQLNMKIGDVEFQGDGSKAIFYYIADERVDFRQLIKNFAEEFRIRIEMKQIGARQEAGLIGGLGVCGQALCCSRYMSDFQSITTQAARCQDLSLNPQKLAGQCGKLKCCINYEASTYIDAQSSIPKITEPLQFEDGEAHLMKTDILRGIMWFSYDPHSMANMKLLTAKEVKEIILLNKKGIKSPSLFEEALNKSPEFLSAVGEDSISRFDVEKNKKRTNINRQPRDNNKKRWDNKDNKDKSSDVKDI